MPSEDAPSWARMLRGLWADQRVRWARRAADRARGRWKAAQIRLQHAIAATRWLQ